ncbi:hypothetical protein [Frigidibacter sp. SD6-1]|uniref:hypothetical protein n=1 Tax=Frigidibacter sp. SD6-1 TaxID=3032581 RepID=UPI0024DFFEC6|nr:hypothetical protein [Frigidibacter sp. SD6-1]
MNLAFAFFSVCAVALVVSSTWLLAAANGRSRLKATLWAASPLIVLYGSFFVTTAIGVEQTPLVGLICFCWLAGVNFWQAAAIRKKLVRNDAAN